MRAHTIPTSIYSRNFCGIKYIVDVRSNAQSQTSQSIEFLTKIVIIPTHANLDSNNVGNHWADFFERSANSVSYGTKPFFLDYGWQNLHREFIHEIATS